MIILIKGVKKKKYFIRQMVYYFDSTIIVKVYFEVQIID